MKCDWYNTIKTALAYGLSLIMILLTYGQASAQSQHIKQGETPKGINTSEWASIQKQMQMSKYKAYPQTDGRYTSANLAHGLQIAYNKDGKTALTPRNCDQADYNIAMQLQGIGYQELTPLKTPIALSQENLGTASGSKVAYQWNTNLREWWINDKKGLEQWFSLREAPQGRKPNTPLHLRMALQTDMQVTLQNNRLQLQKGNTTLHYDKLKVWDATGKEIQAEMHYIQGFIDFYIQEASATYPLLIDPTWTHQAYLKASNTEGDSFGYSVAISGETIVVGAHYEDSNAIGVNGDQTNNGAINSGAAYIFVRNGTTWTQQAYLKASNTQTGDYFGWSVAISGETVVVGAYQEASNATGVNGNQANNSAFNSGAVYVFVRSGNAWTQQAYLKASNTDASDVFGSSVAIAGETVVVGAVGEDSNAVGVSGNQIDNSASYAGAAYIFVRNAGVWTQQAYLKASNTGAGDFFGYSVAISGETVVVGASRESSNAIGVNGNQTDNSNIDAGAAYIFVRSGTAWIQQAYLKASNTDADDEFGYSVGISGETVVVGAYQEDSNAIGIDGNQTNNGATNAGAAYIFIRSGTTWTQQAYLKASNTDASDEFGYSVAISGETVVIGADRESSNATGIDGNQTNNGAVQSGAVYVFVRSGTTWTQQAYLKASNTEAEDFFGNSVAISGETIIVGAYLEDSNATGVNGDGTNNAAVSAGAVYVFLVIPSPEINLKQNTTPIANAGSYDFGAFSVSQSSGSITFTIENTGNLPLNLTGSPKIVKSGTNANDFTITETLPATINANGSATFTINFTPSGVGTRSAQISIANNDSNENPYIVNLTGVGNIPIIAVSGNGNIITNGNTTPSTTNHTNFANWALNTPITRTFTIENTGSASLNITDITLTGVDATAFSITQQPATTVAVGQSATFVVSHTPTQATTTKNAIVNIANNSATNPFTFAIRGSDIALSLVPRLSVGKVGIYPNPAKDILTVSVEGNPVTEIAVILFDAQGKSCIECTLPVEGCKAHLPLQGIASGLYLLHMQVGKEWITEKVIVVR